MSTSVEELAAKAQELSPEDRARLAENLLASLQDEPQSEVEAAWDREIERRVEQVRAGTAQLIPAEDVHADARQIYR
jgi:putative addiction module component (TIGR02574 family)